MIPPCPRYKKDDFKKTRDRNAHLNQKHKCPIKNITSISTTNPILIPQIDSEADDDTKHQISDSFLDHVSDSSGLSNKNTMDLDKYLFREEFEYLKALDLIKKDTVLDIGINFTQIRVSDPKRPHDNFKLL
ncbi:28258_t:CDS:1, partial [Gigaspora margarita]